MERVSRRTHVFEDMKGRPIVEEITEVWTHDVDFVVDAAYRLLYRTNARKFFHFPSGSVTLEWWNPLDPYKKNSGPVRLCFKYFSAGWNNHWNIQEARFEPVDPLVFLMDSDIFEVLPGGCLIRGFDLLLSPCAKRIV